MIHALTIRGFKRFTSNTFALAPLTVLTGLNGTGKTSLLHALLVAREAASAPEATVALNGPYGLELGTAGAVRNWDADGAMEVELSEGEHTHVWRFEVPADDALHLGVLARASTPPACFASVPRSALAPPGNPRRNCSRF